MKIEGWDAAIDAIEQGVEGEGYWVDFVLSGDFGWFEGWACHEPRGGVVQMDKADHPPMFVDIAAIAAVRLSVLN